MGRCELVFENCFVPEENVLGKEGKGLAISFVVVFFIIFKMKSSLYYLVGFIWIYLRKNELMSKLCFERIF